MKRNIKRFGVVVLVGSLAFSVSVTFEPFRDDLVRQRVVYKQSLKEKITAYLTDKGIEAKVVEKLFDENHNFIESSVEMLSSVLNVSENKVIEKISNKILHQNSLNLNSADALISVAQSLTGGYVPSESLDKIHKFVKG